MDAIINFIGRYINIQYIPIIDNDKKYDYNRYVEYVKKHIGFVESVFDMEIEKYDINELENIKKELENIGMTLIKEKIVIIMKIIREILETQNVDILSQTYAINLEINKLPIFSIKNKNVIRHNKDIVKNIVFYYVIDINKLFN